MPQGLKIQKRLRDNPKLAKKQDSGLMVKISQQATGTSEFSTFFCSGTFSDLEIWLFKPKKYHLNFAINP